MTTTTTDRYYVSNTGRTTCADHGGGYLTAALYRNPRARRIETPLDVWHLMTKTDLDELRGTYPAICETCQHQRDRA